MSRSAPLIGVSTSITVAKHPERAYLNSAYLHAVQQAGGVPVPLPPQLSAASLERLGGALHGLLLTGGGDVDPALFGEAPHETLYDVAPARDALEASALSLALRRRLPVLAVCRGIQVLNVALGGSLHQHIADAVGGAVQHAQTEPRHVATHPVKVLAEGTRLGRIVGAPELAVNSFHHQALRTLGRGLREVAWAPDQVIEAVEHEDPDRFVVAVQWHPEDLVQHDAAARALFGAVVAAAREHGRT